jgi:hypothetical protein
MVGNNKKLFKMGFEINAETSSVITVVVTLGCQLSFTS